MKIARLISFATMIVMLLVGGTGAFAEENIGVTDKAPVFTEEGKEGEISVFGIAPPTTAHNLATQGQMDFSGVASGSTLYTNKFFKGKSKVELYVLNSHATANLKVTVMKGGLIDTTVWSTTVVPRGAVYINLDLSSTAEYYIKFSAPSNFSGYVK